MKQETPVPYNFLDDKKSEEVQEILSKMPKWISTRGIFAILLIAGLLVFGGFFIKYPETYKTSFHLPNNSLSKEGARPLSGIIITTTLNPLLRKGQPVVLLFGGKKKIKGRIEAIQKERDSLMLSISTSDPQIISGTADSTVRSGTMEVTTGERNFFRFLFR
jgi:hypothetical protein